MTLILSGTDGLSDVDGSAATPAIRGTDTNTGIFFPAADTIAFSEGGVESMRLDSSGNLGIGTSSPVYQTQIYGTGQTTAALTDAGNKGGSLLLNTPTVSAGDGGALLLGAGGSGAKPFAAIKGLLADGGGNTTGSIAFSTRNATGDTALTERCRIDSSGNFWVRNNGTTQPWDATSGTFAKIGDASYPIGVTSQSNLCAIFNRNTATGSTVEFKYNAVPVGSISVTASTTAYNTSSDYRLKYDIKPLSGALSKIASLKPVTYKWKADDSEGEGFIAHELAEVCPQAVAGEKDAVDAEGNPVYQGIDTSFLVATLTAAIQEQQTLIQSLTARIEALEGK